MSFADDIVDRAVAWYQRDCRETTANRGPCVDEIHERFDPNWIRNKRSEAWCAKFCYVVVDEAARMDGIKNPLPRTAGARDLLERSIKAGLRVDRQPARGSIFYRRSGAPNATGHNGIVVGGRANGGGITTIEGNLNNRVSLYGYTNGQIEDLDFRFIHVEDAAGAPLLAGSNVITTLLLLSAGIGTLWYINKGRR